MSNPNSSIKVQKEFQNLRSLYFKQLKKYKDIEKMGKIGYWTLDIENDNLEWSDEIFHIFELSSNFTPSYESFLSMIHPQEQSYVHNAYQNSLQNQESYEITHRIMTPNGTIKWLKEKCETLFNEDGKPYYSSGIVQDITEIKIKEEKILQLNKELTQLNESLEEKVYKRTKELNRLNKELEKRIEKKIALLRDQDNKMLQQAKMVSLGELVRNIAHQWRQPLGTISVSASGMLMHSEIEQIPMQMQKEYLLSIINNAKALSKTIDTFASFVSSKEKNISQIVLQDEIYNALELLSENLAYHNITVYKNNIEKDALVLDSIKNEFSQVVMNLLSNSIDALYSLDKTEKWISIGLKKMKKHIKFSFEDNGNGIDEAIIERIFEPYFTTKHKTQGTGLGLYMSYKIINDVFQGDIQVKNTPNGVKFTIKIPLIKRHL